MPLPEVQEPERELARPPLIAPTQTFTSITEKISSVVLRRWGWLEWVAAFGGFFTLFMLLFLGVTWLLIAGIGIWGVNIPVAWGFAITNFVWWIGIGHAGTLISAILLLLNQKWRNSINRFAEAMTLFAVACAGLFPLLHLGRPYFFYWLLPYPNTMELWPQFRSPLVWDVFAVLTYGTVSLIFWYIGMLPDLAALRDHAQNRFAWAFFGVLAMGWRGAARHWQHYYRAYFLLAALATPLVVSVHTIVSFDFAVSLLPGWHSTIFPPYFVAGAVFSGFAMVLSIAIPLRLAFGLQDFITDRHLENMAKVLLTTSLMVTYSYIFEHFFAWYSFNQYERALTINRATGAYALLFWTQIVCNVCAPQVLWFQWARRNTLLLFVLSIVVNIGMWVERLVIVIASLYRDFLPSSWKHYSPTVFDFSMFAGTIGLFFTLMFLFLRFVPMIPIFEMKVLLPETKVDEQKVHEQEKKIEKGLVGAPVPTYGD